MKRKSIVFLAMLMVLSCLVLSGCTSSKCKEPGCNNERMEDILTGKKFDYCATNFQKHLYDVR